ncbi:cytosine-specific methyltransferase [Clostridia bacterium]|nr:cytosine-specific methyltransferase [Clostridia bacterium]
MTFIDLFCGIGVFRLALEKYGHNCVFSSDIDNNAKTAYSNNFKELPSGDITQIKNADIPKHDILCAGFPCQPFSISGKQLSDNDPRGKLFFEIVRIAEFYKPKILLLENVKNILTIDNGSMLKTIVSELNRIGYRFSYSVLNSSYFGIPQKRERVYFVAIKKDLNINYTEPNPTKENIFLDDVLEKNADNAINRNDIKITKQDFEIQKSLEPIRVGTVNKGGQGERIYSIKGHAITQSAYGGGVGARTGLYRTVDDVRRLTLTECKRVMGFPDSHIVSNGLEGYKQLGNAVIPKMVSVVYEGLNI